MRLLDGLAGAFRHGWRPSYQVLPPSGGASKRLLRELELVAAQDEAGWVLNTCQNTGRGPIFSISAYGVGPLAATHNSTAMRNLLHGMRDRRGHERDVSNGKDLVASCASPEKSQLLVSCISSSRHAISVSPMLVVASVIMSLSTSRGIVVQGID